MATVTEDFQMYLQSAITGEMDWQYKQLIEDGATPDEAKEAVLEALRDAVAELTMWHRFD